MVSRRGFIASEGAVVAAAAGSVWTVFSGDDQTDESSGTAGTEQNSTDKKASERPRNESGNEAGDNTSEETNASQNGAQNESNETEYPEAANPEPEPEGPETNESVINESRAGSEPSASDVIITENELVTASDGAAVVGVVRNDAAEPVTVELAVTFLQNGEQIGRPALNGTTDLPVGETWDFTVRAMGSEYSGATEYEISKSVQISG